MPQQFLGFEGKSPLRSLWYLHPGHIWGCGSCRFWQVQSMVSSTQHFIHYTYAAPYAVHWAKVMTRLVSICLCVCVSVCTHSRSLRCLCHRSDQRSRHSYKTVMILVLNIWTVRLQLLFCYDAERQKSCVKRNFNFCKPSEPDISVKRLPLGACGGPILKSGETPWCWIVRLAHNVRGSREFYP